MLLLILPRSLSGLLFLGILSGWGAYIGLRLVNNLPQIQRSLVESWAFHLHRLSAWVKAHRGLIVRAASLAALLFMIASAFFFRPTGTDALLDEAAWLMFLGAAALWLGLALGRPALSLAQPAAKSTSDVRMSRWYRLALVLGIVILALLAEISGSLLDLPWLSNVSTHLQMGMLAVSIILIAWGLGAGGVFPKRWFKLDWLEILAVLAIAALALALRLWKLDDTVRFPVDEFNTITEVYAFTSPEQVGLLTPMTGISPFPWIFAYWQAQGVNALGHTYAGLRAASAVTGMLTVVALYMLAKALFDRKTALLAAFLLAVFPPHIHFSRLALLNIADPLIGTLTFAFLARAIKFNSRLDYALGGVCCGLTQYFYEGGRLLYPPIVLAWLVGGFILWRPRPNLRYLAVTVAAALIFFIPIYYTILSLGTPLTGRMEASGQRLMFWGEMFEPGKSQVYLRHFFNPFLFYVHIPDMSLYYGGQTPLVLSFLVPSFLLGVFFLLWHWRKPTVLVLLWLLATSLGNNLLLNNTWSTRFVGVFPAIALTIAMGIRYTLPLLFPDFRLRWPRLRHVSRHDMVFAGLAVICAIIQIAYYFGPHLEYFNRQSRGSRFARDAQDAVLRSRDFPSRTQIHIIDEYIANQGEAQMMLTFFSPDKHMRVITYDRDDLTPRDLAELHMGSDHVFFIEPDDRQILALLRHYFYLREPELSPYDTPPDKQYVMYYAPYIPGYSEQLRPPTTHEQRQ